MLPPGYNFDCVNADVLNRMKVKDGRLVLPNGITYQLLILPTGRTMSPEVFRRIRDLNGAGAAVLGQKPIRAPGLANWPECDRELRKVADVIRDEPSGLFSGEAIDEGCFYGAHPVGEVLEALDAPPDFEAPDNNAGFEFTHRVIDDADFYFVSNQASAAKNGHFVFRVKNRVPELWDPVTGIRRDLTEFKQTEDGRVRISMRFEPYQSLFVVFRKPIDRLAKSDGKPNFPELTEVAELTGPWTVASIPSGVGRRKWSSRSSKTGRSGRRRESSITAERPSIRKRSICPISCLCRSKASISTSARWITLPAFGSMAAILAWYGRRRGGSIFPAW